MSLDICRICLSKSEKLINIFVEESVQRNVASIIKQHFWFQIVETDEFSKKICLICWDKIDTFHTFYKEIESLYKSTNWDDFVIENKNFELTEYSIEENYVEDCHVNDDSHIFVKLEADAVDDIPDQYENVQSTNVKTDSENSDNGSSDTDEKPPQDRIKRQCTLKKIDDNELNLKLGVNNIQNKRDQKSSEELEKLKVQKREKIITENDQIRQFCIMQCDLCGDDLNDFSNAKVHYRNKHKIDGYLICCERKIKKRCILVTHIRQHIFPDEFRCEPCNKIFKDKSFLKLHMDTIHSTEKPSFQCDVCPKAYHSNYALNRHKEYHNEKKFPCKECGKYFITNSVLKSHIRAQHQNAYVHVCDICARSFKMKQVFEQHMKVMHKEHTKVQCSICGAWLKHEGSLKRHMKNHEDNGKGKCVCNVCGKESPNRGAHLRHYDYMHKLKPLHTCEICEKSFKRAITLKEHMTTHTGEGYLYTCPFCPKTFNSSANMHAHKKKMHPIEWEESKKKSN